MFTNHVSVRLDEATISRVDALAPLFSTEWRLATRSDILRGLILASLERTEQEQEIVHFRGERLARDVIAPPTTPPSPRPRRKRANTANATGGAKAGGPRAKR